MTYISRAIFAYFNLACTSGSIFDITFTCKIRLAHITSHDCASLTSGDPQCICCTSIFGFDVTRFRFICCEIITTMQARLTNCCVTCTLDGLLITISFLKFTGLYRFTSFAEITNTFSEVISRTSSTKSCLCACSARIITI